ncbi:hypothetical protein JL830_18050 [Vibrio parahaemolyticus]|uniref:hypothetical protein n=1 Tax=Vibrio parahaemolyticus TaxID=670 RepID=UPI001FAD5239|nr:hypothetical protein [Vibrio parahaemolyticus]MCI9700797.1 hypothetical protein [Vibrio parahaemolyticus]
MDLLSLFSHVTAFLLGGLAIYLTAYSKAKGVNKALKEDINELESSKQRIITNHALELEKIKKHHALDIERRKYQYDSKKVQFENFFRLIDEFNRRNNNVFRERFPILFERLLCGCMSGDPAKTKESTLSFNREMMALFNELNREQTKVTTESNGIRLVASEVMDRLLDELENAIAAATEGTMDMLKFLATPEYMANQSLLEPYQNKVTQLGERVISCRDALKGECPEFCVTV